MGVPHSQGGYRDAGPWERGLLRLAERGQLLSYVLVTAASIAVSVIVSAVLYRLVGVKVRRRPVPLVLPVVIPLLVAPTVARPYFRLLRRLHAAREDLERQAATDELTGLPNRREYFERAGEEFARFRRYGRDLSVMMIDADRFKAINDRYGHATGDQVLHCLAQSLQASIRPNDVVGRLGGEEFACLIPEVGEEGTERLAERLRSAIAELAVETPAGSIGLRASFGVASCAETDGSIHEALLRADDALREAKALGGDHVIVASARR